jgi:hypothetical protein
MRTKLVKHSYFVFPASMLSAGSLCRLKVCMFSLASLCHLEAHMLSADNLRRVKVRNTKKLFQSGPFAFTFFQGRNPMGESLRQKKSLPRYHFSFPKFLTLHSLH